MRLWHIYTQIEHFASICFLITWLHFFEQYLNFTVHKQAGFFPGRLHTFRFGRRRYDVGYLPDDICTELGYQHLILSLIILCLRSHNSIKLSKKYSSHIDRKIRYLRCIGQLNSAVSMLTLLIFAAQHPSHPDSD